MDHDPAVLENVGACGFYCGSCPTFRRGECAGCRKLDDNRCFTYRCVSRRGLDFCAECVDFPCTDLLTREKVTVLDRRWLRWQREKRRETDRGSAAQLPEGELQ